MMNLKEQAAPPKSPETTLKAEIDTLKTKARIDAFDLKKLTSIISQANTLFIFSNFPIIQKIVRPLIDAWPKRPQMCPINNELARLFTKLNNRLSRFSTRLHIVLPDYLRLKQYFQKRSRILIKNIGGQIEPKTDPDSVEEFVKRLLTKEDKKGLPRLHTQKNNKFLADIDNKIKSNAYKDKIKLDNKSFNETVQKKLSEKTFINRECLVCTQKFYDGSDFLYDPGTSFYEVDTFGTPKSDKILSTSENEIKGVLCSFLNSDRGGVMLGGCEKVGTSIIIHGSYMTEKEKEAHQQRVEKYMDSFKPRLTRNKEVFIDFVPVFTNPFENKEGKEAHKVGEYVMRIFVSPKEPENTYSYKHASDTQVSDENWIQVRENGNSLSLKGEAVYEFIKKRVAKFTIPKEAGFDKCDLHEIFEKKKMHHCHYGSLCEEVIQGEKIYEEVKVENQQPREAMEEKKNEAQSRDQYVEQQSVTGHEGKDYKNRSLLIAEEKMKKKLEEILTEGTRAKGGEKPKIKRFKIEKKFENSGFYMIPHTWIVHHDDKFETIKREIDKGRIVFKGKHAPLIATTKNLEVGYLDEGSLQQMTNYLYSQLMYEEELKEFPMFEFVYQQEDNLQWKTILMFKHYLSAIFTYMWYDNSKLPVKYIRSSKIKFNKEEGQKDQEEDN